jgi:hypothetical protein
MSELFAADPATQQPTVTTNVESTQTSDFQLIGEGKKYKDFHMAEKALIAQHSHIDTIQNENANLRKELEAAKAAALQGRTYEDVLAAFESKQANVTSSDATDTPKTVATQTNSATFTPDDLYKHFKEKDAKEANRRMVETKLKELYGDKAKEQAIKLAGSYGLSLDELTGLAEKSPKLIIDKLDTNNSRSAVTSSFNSDASGAVDFINSSGQYDYTKDKHAIELRNNKKYRELGEYIADMKSRYAR